MTKFGVGEYKTRDGCLARVEFVMREPCRERYVLRGQLQDEDGSWTPEDWTEDGVFYKPADGSSTPENVQDLMPPVRYVWRWISLGLSGGWCSDLKEAMVDAKGCEIGFLRGELNDCNRVDTNKPFRWFTTDEAFAEMRKEYANAVHN